ncbi:hypothetical protein GDO86_009220 [Hymenochirus boettgeri]|uniref:Laminin G domain-containing protein n=1 Tax=Hymenochirus boettgeri TaxID=247094 RepID=A0A8T2JI25_9PIPI|nr:hypothetical protein GDO86_009220 [Hymenochirus boettgeri]
MNIYFIILSVEDVVISSVEVQVCDNEHIVEISASNDDIVLTFDGVLGQKQLSDSELRSAVFTLNDHMGKGVKTYVGGLPDVAVTSTPVTAFYNGCMTMKIQNKPVDLDDAVHKHNDITSHSCPPIKPGE